MLQLSAGMLPCMRRLFKGSAPMILHYYAALNRVNFKEVATEFFSEFTIETRLALKNKMLVFLLRMLKSMLEAQVNILW